MRYNAGSEIYTQALARGLFGRGHVVSVFSREEVTFRPDYAVDTEADSNEPGFGSEGCVKLGTLIAENLV